MEATIGIAGCLFGGCFGFVLGHRGKTARKVKRGARRMLRTVSSKSFEYNKASNPREWAIWSTLDLDHDGRLTREEVFEMCCRLDAHEHAQLVADAIDPDQDGKSDFGDFCQNFEIISVVRKAARLRQWHRCFGLGVAGNTAGHMAQAGEAAAGHVSKAPANVFTFYQPHPRMPGVRSYDEVLTSLEVFPVSFSVIKYPDVGGHVQVEPEMGLYVDIVYAKGRTKVERLDPREICAFNDCSIRELKGSSKLSEKKNWGKDSKGMSVKRFRVDTISKGSAADRFVIVSYVKRSDKTYLYSKPGAARDYLMFHDELLDWIVERINYQQDSGKWLPIWPDIVKADYPSSMWIALGAGEYTDWGQNNFLLPADEALVIIYDEKFFPEGPNEQIIGQLFDDIEEPEGIIAMHQTFSEY